MPPPGFKIIHNAVSEEAWEEIRSYLGLDTRKENLGIDIISEGMNSNTCTKNRDSTSTGTSHHHNDVPWESTPVPQNRSVAQFGFRYDYKEDIVIAPSKSIASTRGTCTGNNSSCSKEKMNRNDTDAASKDEDVPDIPEIFNRLLIRPMGKFQFQFQFVKEEKETLESEMGTCSRSTTAQSDVDSIEFTQCIINVYRPCDHGNAVNDVVKSSAGTCTDAGVNFNSGSHIPWHVDDLKFGPTIVVYTFGDDDNHPIRPLHMRSSLNSVQFNSEEQINKDADVQVHIPVGVDRDRDKNAGGGTKVNLDSGRSSDTEYCYYTSHPRHCSCYILSGEARYDWEHSVPTGSGWRVSITFRTFHSD